MSKLALFTNNTCEELLSQVAEHELTSLYNGKLKELTLDVSTMPSEIELDNIDLAGGADEDCVNSIAVWKALKNVDRRIASDRRLWVTLTHTRFLAYSVSRWNSEGKGLSHSVVKQRFHFEGYSQKTRLRNSVSRLWWGCELTHDANSSDPFSLTRQFWEYQDVVSALGERRFVAYPSVLRAFLDFLRDNPTLKRKRDDVRLLAKTLNAYGGVYNLGYLREDEIFELLKKWTARL